MAKHSSGFTLIEIAIVLVIIGLLLGGVLKGQELVANARVRNLISQQDGVRAAFFGFQDRYRALPGDYAAASTSINCNPACFDGDGNGQIENPNLAATPTNESILAWTHLSAAGFITGSYAMATATDQPSDTNSPKNPYGVYLQIVYDDAYGSGPVGAPLLPPPPPKHNLKTGGQVPVEIIAEVDRKIDDGKPLTGGFQFSVYKPTNATFARPFLTGSGACVTGSSPTPTSDWDIPGSPDNCGGASLF